MEFGNQDVPQYKPVNVPKGHVFSQVSLEPDSDADEVDVFWIYNAVIDEIRTEERVTYVAISYTDQAECVAQPIRVLELMISEQETRLFYRDKRPILLSGLETGMRIDVLVSAKMTKNIPPRTWAYEVLAVAPSLNRKATVGRIVQVNIRNDYLLIVPEKDPDQILRINLNAETVLIASIGRKICIQELSPGMSVRVEHDWFTTESIPPQTLGFVVRILDQ